MKRDVDKLVAPAIKAAEKHLAKNGIIASQYNGYISSFGAAVIQSGLLPAVAFNENKSANSEQDRPKLMKAILEIVKGEAVGENDKLINYVIDSKDSDKEILTKRRVLNAAIALKLAIRTFDLKEMSVKDE